MSLVGSYDSDDEARAAKRARIGNRPNAQAKPQAKRRFVRGPEINALRLRYLQNEIATSNSATAVVQMIRREISKDWDARWGAMALLQVAKKSTAKTRKEWAADKAVKKLGLKLVKEVLGEDSWSIDPQLRPLSEIQSALCALEGLRRMSLQDSDEQKAPLEHVLKWFNATGWGHPVKILACFVWLAGPLNLSLDGGLDEIKRRPAELDGEDLLKLLAAIRGGMKDFKLQTKVIMRLRMPASYKGLRASELIDVADHFGQLRKTNKDDDALESALKVLGQEMLGRWPELTADEGQRAQMLYQAMSMPLPSVWTPEGTKSNLVGGAVVTTQTFTPRDGHTKPKRRAIAAGASVDLERISPPRVVRDFKMASY